MRPSECGTCRPPGDGTPDREALDRFADFLRDVRDRGRDAVLADPQWAAYIAGQEEPGERLAESILDEVLAKPDGATA